MMKTCTTQISCKQGFSRSIAAEGRHFTCEKLNESKCASVCCFARIGAELEVSHSSRVRIAACMFPFIEGVSAAQVILTNVLGV